MLIHSCFRSPAFILPLHPDHFRDIQQVVQGIGTIPEFVLLPQVFRHRPEEELVDVFRAGGREFSAATHEGEPPSPKKPASVQEISSITSFRQEAVSCSSSGQAQEGPCITG